MTSSGTTDKDSAELHPTVALLLEALRAVRERFVDSDPPIRSLHASLPAKPRPDPGKVGVWFLLPDDELVRARECGILAEVQSALAQELAARGNPERDLGEMFVDLVPRSQHDWRTCCGRADLSQRGPDRAAK